MTQKVENIHISKTQKTVDKHPRNPQEKEYLLKDSFHPSQAIIPMNQLWVLGKKVLKKHGNVAGDGRLVPGSFAPNCTACMLINLVDDACETVAFAESHVG